MVKILGITNTYRFRNNYMHLEYKIRILNIIYYNDHVVTKVSENNFHKKATKRLCSLFI